MYENVYFAKSLQALEEASIKLQEILAEMKEVWGKIIIINIEVSDNMWGLIWKK